MELLNHFAIRLRELAQRVFAITRLLFRAAALLVMLIGCLGPVASRAVLIQQLDATVSSSVTTNGSGVVIQWGDQSGSGNHAVSNGGVGSVYYPGTSLSASGKAGLNFGTNLNMLVALDATKASNTLNSASGFAVMVAFKADSIRTNDFNDVIGCGSLTAGFGLRYGTTGAMSAYLSTNSVSKGGANLAVAAGDTIVFGFNYDDTTGKYSFWDSKNSSALTGTLTASQKNQNNFSAGKALTMGAMAPAGNRYMNGMIGEVRVYDATLSSNEFSAAQTEMVNTWVGYRLTVNSGSGSGTYGDGQSVAIAASNLTGKAFVAWTGDTQYLAGAGSSASNTVTMPTNPVTLTATYVDTIYTLTVNNGSGSGTYDAGAQVPIAANPVNPPSTFVSWIGDTQYLSGAASSASNTVTMPSNAVMLTATYLLAQHFFVHPLFQHNMVLQRDMDVPVWGRALTGTVVTLKLDGATVGTAVTDPDGKWVARIGSHAHDGGVPHALEISAPDELSVTLTNIVFGDVYLASGQSNMELQLNNSTVIGGAAEIAAANYPLVRQVSIANVTNPVSLTEPSFKWGWTLCSPATANRFSATGYFFAKNVHLQTGVPVGLLFSAWGAKEIKRFIAPEGVAAIPELTGLHQFLEGGGDAAYYDIYNGMIAPLIPYGMRGAIWYQGEWDAGRGGGDHYHQHLRALMAGWRQNWGQGDFPFYYVQLPNYGSGFGAATIREAELRALSETNCGMAVTIDTGDGNLHPRNKQDVGSRLALWAVARDAGQNIPYRSPLLSGVTNEGGYMRIYFDYADAGLMVGSKDSTNPVVVSAGPLENFEVAGSDKVFVAATAAIDGYTVVVSNASVAQPVYVRYCYTNMPAGTNKLYNLAGLPASPFRTDVDYPLTVQSGSGDTTALVPGAVQSITADAAPAGMVFDRWIGTASDVDNLNASSTVVTMPQHALYLLAAYRSTSSPVYTLTVNQGYGSGTSQAGSYLNIEAQSPVSGWIFDHWAGDTQTVDNVLSSSTTLKMPDSDVTVVPIYKVLVTAQFVATPTNGARPLAVTFTDQSTGSPTNLLWSFGDGQTTNTAGGALVGHVYQSSGNYTVTLIASGVGGAATNNKAGYITVNAPQPPKISDILVAAMPSGVLVTGSGGPTNGIYYYWVRSATNITMPLSNWSFLATNQFYADGSFSNWLPVQPLAPQQFYRLQLP